jgi:hypothetical protein
VAVPAAGDSAFFLRNGLLNRPDNRFLEEEDLPTLDPDWLLVAESRWSIETAAREEVFRKEEKSCLPLDVLP